MAKKTYTVKTAVIHDRKIYEAGQGISLDDEKLASTLLKRGQIVEGASKPPAEQQPPKAPATDN